MPRGQRKGLLRRPAGRRPSAGQEARRSPRRRAGAADVAAVPASPGGRGGGNKPELASRAGVLLPGSRRGAARALKPPDARLPSPASQESALRRPDFPAGRGSPFPSRAALRNSAARPARSGVGGGAHLSPGEAGSGPSLCCRARLLAAGPPPRRLPSQSQPRARRSRRRRQGGGEGGATRRPPPPAALDHPQPGRDKAPRRCRRAAARLGAERRASRRNAARRDASALCGSSSFSGARERAGSSSRLPPGGASPEPASLCWAPDSLETSRVETLPGCVVRLEEEPVPTRVFQSLQRWPNFYPTSLPL